MSLIDSNALLRQIEESKQNAQQGLNKDAKFAYATHDYFAKMVKAQPTAYNVDAVVEQLDKAYENFGMGNDCNTCKMKKICDDGQNGCVETMSEVYKRIVKGGGLDGKG